MVGVTGGRPNKLALEATFIIVLTEAQRTRSPKVDKSTDYGYSVEVSWRRGLGTTRWFWFQVLGRPAGSSCQPLWVTWPERGRDLGRNRGDPESANRQRPILPSKLTGYVVT